MIAAVRPFAEDKLRIVARKLQRRRHFLIRKRPIPMFVVEIIGSVLQEYAERFPLGLANQGDG